MKRKTILMLCTFLFASGMSATAWSGNGPSCTNFCEKEYFNCKGIFCESKIMACIYTCAGLNPKP